MPSYFYSFGLFICLGGLGLILGSFVNVIIARYPKMLEARWQRECQDYLSVNTQADTTAFNLMQPASHCPRCQHRLAWHELIPLLSYFLLKGHCHYCHQKISARYPVVECLSAALLLIIGFRFGFTIYALSLMLLAELLLALFFIDLNTQLLPDDFTLPALWLGLIMSLYSPLTNPTEAILGASMAYVLPWGIALLFKWIRHKEGMGHGDFKLFALWGAWLGIQMLPLLFLLAVFLGLIFSVSLLVLKKISFQQRFAFGPAIILAGVLLLLQVDVGV